MQDFGFGFAAAVGLLMKNKRAIFLGFVSVVLIAYIGFDIWQKPGTTELRRQARRVGAFKYTKVQKFELDVPKGSFAFVKKEKNKWEIEKPIQFPADREFVHEALVEIEIAERLDTLKVEDWSTALERYGLKYPRIKAVLTKGKKSQVIAIGKETPVPNTVYAMLSDDKKREVIVLSQEIEEFLNRDLDTWRSHKIFDFYPELITGIHVRQDQREVEIKKEEKKWEISKPLVTKADSRAVLEFLRKVAQLRAGKFVSDGDATQASYGLSAPTLIFEVSDYKNKYTLKIGSPTPDDPNLVYASYEPRSAVFTFSKAVLDMLSDVLNSVRDRRVVSYPYTASVNKLDVEFKGKKYQFQRVKGRQWKLEGDEHAAEFAMIDNLLGQLFALRVKSYPEMTDAKDFGFKKPTATVYWNAEPIEVDSEIRDPRPASEVKEEELVFGAVEGDEIYLQTPRQLSIVTVSKRILDHFPQDIWNWYSLNVLTWMDKPVHTLTWSASGKYCVVEILSDERKLTDKESEGYELNKKILKLQLKVLKDLKAIRWVGPVQESDFKKPLLVLDIERGGHIDRLTFGKILSDDTVLTRLGDDKYAFVVRKDDFQALALFPRKREASEEPQQPKEANQ